MTNMADDDEPMLTLVVELMHDARTRYILARGGLQAGPLMVVVDSAQRIPVFESEAAARAHAARHFPPWMPGVETLDEASLAEMAAMLAPPGVTRVDFDRALQWAADPASRLAGPMELALVWEMLAGADAAPAMASFDPMSLPALNDWIRAGGPEGEMAQLALTGMMLSGVVSQAMRRGAADDASWPADIAEIWTAENDAALARIIRDGVSILASRLLLPDP
jgi:hypothetical protein